MVNIATHNGELTIKSVKTGEHRTVRVRTQPADSKFAPGERVVSLLVGSNNEDDYSGFAFVKSDGRVILWKSARGSEFYQWLARFLMAGCERADVEVNFSGRCRKCNRKLTTPESIESGIGPVCSGKG